MAIANWNGGQHITRCLDSLYAQSRKPDEIVIVDNGSTDGSPTLIRRNYPQVRLLTRPCNEGFCAGYNRAIRATGHPFVLILNSDVFLDPNFLAAAAASIVDDPEIGWVAGPVARADENGYDFQGRYLLKRLALVNSTHPHDREDVFAGSGAVIFCRRAMLDDIAYRGQIYDEAYFAYIEDLDLAWRAQLRGWRCMYRSDLLCHHVGSASQGGRVRVVDKSVQFLIHIIKNRYLTLVKNATPGILVRFLPSFLLGEMVLWMLLGVRFPRKLLSIPAAIKLTAGLLPSTLLKRRHVMRRRKVSDRRILELTKGS